MFQLPDRVNPRKAGGAYGVLPRIARLSADMINSTRNTKNRIWAMLAAAPARPVKPSMPATKARMRNASVQLSIISRGCSRYILHNSCQLGSSLCWPRPALAARAYSRSSSGIHGIVSPAAARHAPVSSIRSTRIQGGLHGASCNLHPR